MTVQKKSEGLGVGVDVTRNRSYCVNCKNSGGRVGGCEPLIEVIVKMQKSWGGRGWVRSGVGWEDVNQELKFF